MSKPRLYLRKMILVAAFFAITAANMAQSREQLDNPDLLLKFREDSISLVSYIRENTKLTEMDAIVGISRLDEWRCQISLGIRDDLKDNATKFGVDMIVLPRRWYAKNGYDFNNADLQCGVYSFLPRRTRETLERSFTLVTTSYRKDHNDILIRRWPNGWTGTVKFPDD